MFEKIQGLIFRKKPGAKKFRNQKSVFFNMTDEYGIKYYTIKNPELSYIRVRHVKPGYIFAEPGMHGDAALIDEPSRHPASIIAENLFKGYSYMEEANHE